MHTIIPTCEDYLDEKQVENFLSRLIKALVIHRPEEPISFLINLLETNGVPEEFTFPKTVPYTINT
jgi:hypothetical protein